MLLAGIEIEIRRSAGERKLINCTVAPLIGDLDENHLTRDYPDERPDERLPDEKPNETTLRKDLTRDYPDENHLMRLP